MITVGSPRLPSHRCETPLTKLFCRIAANQMSQQMAQMNPAANANPFGPGQDPDKMFLAEAENLEVMEHYSILNGVEERLLRSQGVLS